MLWLVDVKGVASFGLAVSARVVCKLEADGRILLSVET